ncbi:sensor histidine kinase [Xylanibacillus composti]|uniref:HAMP domain-containing protein n=1 Tax=Xylanibacillus composti TaxID=1572762 RepID=A0A8J4M2G3_9BACL|nr:histidine kinase [Xylanibacillus composti]MDT9727222.1 sensor histidine kinase [Xylanibacillus composti]GIQ68902.1 hypothetical protein XYCOK13_17260 [Xylanibacillus composti]
MFRTSIRKKLMALLLAATIIPIATSMLVSDWYIKRSVTQKSISENANLLSLGTSNILNYTNTINRISLSAYNSLNTPTSLYAIIEKGAASGIDAEQFDLDNRTHLYTHLLNMFQQTKEVHQIHLEIYGEQRISYLLARGLFRRDIQPQDNPTLAPAATDPLPYVEPAHESTNYRLDWTSYVPKRQVFTLHRPIIRTPQDEVLARLSMDIRTDELFAIARQLVQSPKESLYILNRDGTIVYADDAAQIGGQLETAWSAKLLDDRSPRGHFEWKQDSFSGIIVYDSMQTQYADWLIVKQLPYDYLYEGAQAITKINTYIVACFLVVVIIATLIISFQFAKPIKRLIHSINKVQTGNFNVDIGVQGQDEIGLLARRFNDMVGKINQLINREYKLEIANKNNQLRAMQAQINPHFLNNALQSIGTLALQHGASKVYSLIHALAKMMRYSMNTSETIVPLSAEWNHAKSYLDLQQQRFGEKLNVQAAMDEAALAVKVPKMVLQPLIENYFKHGFDQQEGLGELRMAARLAGESLVLTVEDNGAGVAPERLQQLQKLLALPPQVLLEEQDSIGLSNVQARLKLYYGELAEMKVTAGEERGFRVELRIPVKGVQA